MKKLILFSFVFSAFLLSSCQKQITTSASEKAINLIAPSGKSIAADIVNLKNEASVIIAKKFAAKKQFEITSIQFLDVKSGYAAIISYRLSDGTIGNYADFSGIQFTIQSQSVITDAKSGKKIQSNVAAREDGVGKVTITCTRTGTCECKVEGTVDTNTGVVTWRCSCEQCSAEVVYS